MRLRILWSRDFPKAVHSPVLQGRGRGHTLMKQALPTLPADLADAGIGNSREFLELLAHILVHMGHSPKKFTQKFDEICSGIPEPARAWNPAYLNFLTALPGVIARWHTDEKFINSAGLPVP